MSNVPVRVNGLGSGGRKSGEVPSSRPGNHDKPKRSKLKALILSAAAVIIVAAAVLGALVWHKSSANASIESDKYQAVFFTSGQVYFGKLQRLNNEYFKLSDVFYIQAQDTASTGKNNSKNPQDAAGQQASDLELIKLGSEVHGPEDEMIISKEQILFFENLKKDGKVSSSISTYYNSQGK